MPVGRCRRKPDGRNSHCSCGANHPQPRSLTCYPRGSKSLFTIGLFMAAMAPKELPGPQPCIPPSPTRGILASGYATHDNLQHGSVSWILVVTSRNNTQQGWLLPDSPKDDESYDIFFNFVNMLHKITKLNPCFTREKPSICIHVCISILSTNDDRDPMNPAQTCWDKALRSANLSSRNQWCQ